MNNKTFDFLVFIGRFQPFHRGHLSVIEKGLGQSQQLIVLCSSAHQPRSTRNPWSVAEREAMIRGALNPIDNHRVHVAPLMDNLYNDEAWVRNVQSTVNNIVKDRHLTQDVTPLIGLIGENKNQSAYYLNLFPQWGAVAVDNFRGVDATQVREALFNAEPRGNTFVPVPEINSVLPDNVSGFIADFCASPDFRDLKAEHEFVDKFKQSWLVAPYAPTFVTVDAVLVQSGHILMVERKARPGKGLLALPGGFVDQGEKLVDACIRELREETRLKVPLPVLKGSIKSRQVFDDPFRSARGRTITHAFFIELQPSQELPRVKGGDDARRALWVPLAELNSNTIFEDHYCIIQEMIGL